MSNFLAIATVTAVLKELLQAAALADIDGVTVTTMRPDSAANAAIEPKINIYLYQVTPNAALRNADLPTRRSDGTMVQRPQVALDLHYMISFYGDEGQLQTQRLLGSVVSALHAEPLLAREKIHSIVNPQPGGTGPASDSFPYLAQSNLAEQIELVRFSPLHLSLEELSKIWSIFFQIPYSLSLAYQGSVVLIESDDTPQSTLPVRAYNVNAIPFNQPVIEQITTQADINRFSQFNQPIILGSTLRIRGRQLLGADGTLVRIGSTEVTPAAKNVSSTQITLPLTVNPQESDLQVSTLRAGVQGVQVIQPRLLGMPPTPHRGVESNVAAFVLRPTINLQGNTTFTFPHNPDGTVDGSIDITVSGPPIGMMQRVILLLNELGSTTPPQGAPPARAYSFEASPRVQDPATTISFPIKAVQPSIYLVRISVDGAESPLNVDANGQYAEPQVTIQ